jgi:hypothetical protein
MVPTAEAPITYQILASPSRSSAVDADAARTDLAVAPP